MTDLPPGVHEAALRPANVIGKYVRVERLGAGGGGEVWKAWDQPLRRWVALKFLSSDDPAELARFVREAQMAARLTHPGIGAVHEIAGEDARPFIAMQYIDGATLLSIPRNDRRRIARIVRDAALAVHHAHEHGVVHRDLKPGNVMVDRDDRVFVLDFGLAKQAAVPSSLSISGTVLGTPAYMSPEQAQGRLQQVDARSDVYGLGATLYHLLTGRPPFEDENIYELLVRVVAEDVRRPRAFDATIDPDLEAIAIKCLEKDPARRYETARALADDLGHWLQGGAVTARRAGPLYRLLKALRRRRVHLAAAAALLAAVTLGALLMVHSAHRAAERDALAFCDRAQAHLDEAKRLTRMRAARPDQWERHLAKAEEAANAAIQRCPWLPQAHHALGEVRGNEGRFKEALPHVERALALDSNFADAWHMRGLMHIVLFEHRGTSEGADAHRKAARESLLRYMELRGRDDRASFRFRYADAAAAHANGRHRESIDACEILLKEDPTDTWTWFLKARAQMDLGDYKAAIVTLDSLLNDVMPHHFLALDYRAWSKAQLKDWAGAEADYTAVVALKPRDTQPYSNRAHVRSMRGDLEGAVHDADQAIALDPRYAPAYFTRGFVRSRRGDVDGAVADYTKSIECDPTAAHAYGNRGALRSNLGDLTGALEDLDRAIELDAGSAGHWLNRGITRQKLGDIGSAAADFSRSIELDATQSQAFLNRATIREGLGDSKGAIEDLTAAIGLEPRNADIYARRGAMRSNSGDLAGGLQDHEKAIELDTDLAGAWSNRGVTLMALGRLEESEASFLKAIALDGRYLDAWECLGVVRLRRKHWVGTIDAATQAIALDPARAQPYALRGDARRELGQMEAAIPDYTEALTREPNRAQNYRGRAHARQASGDMTGAIEDYSRAIEIDPGEAASYTARGALRLSRRETELALQDFTKVAGLRPTDFMAHNNLGSAKAALGNHRAAIDDFTRAIELSPGAAVPYENRGRVRLILGDAAGALQDFRRSVELDPALERQLRPQIEECQKQLESRP